MFLHAFKARMKIIFNNKAELFWIIGFPIILATFFYIAFGHMTANTFERIDITVCGVEESDIFYRTLSQTDMFTLSVSDFDSAMKSLESGEIQGVITNNDTLKLYVSGNGINQSITKYVLDSYLQTTQTVSDILMANPSVLQTDFVENIGSTNDYTQDVSLSEEGNFDIVNVFFFAIFGMTAMLGSTYMINVVNTLQANQSPLAVRVCSSPIRKSVVFLANMLAVFLSVFLSIILCMLYIRFILGISMGNHIWSVLLLLLAGTAASVSIGGFICIALKTSENTKNGIIVGLSLMWSAMSGMMSTDIKYTLDRYAPILQKLNPVNLITDGLYSLFFYGICDRYVENVIILAAFTAAFLILTFTIARRQKYASI